MSRPATAVQREAAFPVCPVLLSGGMQVVKLHDDEVDVDEGLVRRLLAAQAPGWADLSLRLAEPAGTDNVMVRLGADLVVRLPRTQSAAKGLDKEQQVVPRLARHLPAPVPVPVVQGVPQDGYPFRWSISPWLPGRPGEPGVADVGLARQLAEFVVALRTLDTLGLVAEGALHSYRGDPLAERDEDTRECIGQCRDLLDISRVAAAWDRAVDVEEYAGPPVWMHADLQPGNLLVGPGGLAAVLDWGMLALGDPAVDCLVAWSLLDATTRSAFRDLVSVDDATWARGRGWALSIALIALPYYVHSNSQITAWARHAITQTVDDALG